MMKRKTGQHGCSQIPERVHMLIIIFQTVHLAKATRALRTKLGHLLSHTTSCKGYVCGNFLQVRVLLKREDI